MRMIQRMFMEGWSPAEEGGETRHVPTGHLGGSKDGLHRPVEERRDERGCRDRHDPRDDDVAGDPPADGREPLRRAGPEHARPRSRASSRADTRSGSPPRSSRRRSPVRRSRSRAPSCTTRWPSVRMIRQPPMYVPSAIESPAETLTQVGISNSVDVPFAKRASAITPIVFCASFAPCVNAMNVPDTSCPSPEAAVRDPARDASEDSVDRDE